MNDKKYMFGCFVTSMNGDLNGDLFRTYIWGDKGINEKLQLLDNQNYGNDLLLILFQFSVNTPEILVKSLKEIEAYRKKEKSIGIPIIINGKNFFSQTEESRYCFLKESILQKLNLLAEVVKKKKLDTNMDLLKADLKNLFNI